MAMVGTRATRKRALPIVEASSSDSESVSSDTDYEPQNELQNDPESDHENEPYEPSGRPTKTPRPNPKPRGPNKTTKQNQNQNQNQDSNEVPLFKALSSKEAATADLALQWVDSYLEDLSHNTCNAMTGLFNFILKCCGCNTLTQNHDMLNDDSASSTVTEVALMFKRQKYHEYPFISNNKEIKFFRHNVVEFFENIVRMGHENGALYKAESSDSSLASPMMTSLLAWLTALSACNVRPFRYVSSTILLSIQSVLCDLVARASISLEKQKRSLDTVRNKQSRKRAHEKQIDMINKTISTFATQKDTLMEYISDIFSSMFINRYRDVDVGIRQECAKYLADWMTIYGEVFLQPEYLRYLGWLLSDPSDHVKEEVIKSLHKLYKTTTSRKDTMGSGFRQFTERFRKQLINMVWVENHTNIKTHLFGVYQELFKLGFLDTDDCNEICSFAFYLVESALVSGPSPKSKLELCKFIVAICSRRSQQEMERFSSFLSSHECSLFDEGPGNLNVSKCLDFKVLAELLDSSYSHYMDEKRASVMDTESEVPFQFMVNRLFSTIYTFPAYQNTWESLIQYTLCDLSSVEFKPKDASEPQSGLIEEELKGRLEFSSSSLKYVALSMISGAILSILTMDKKGAEQADDFNYALPKLVTYFSSLEEYSSSNPRVYAVFMTLWNAVLITIPGHIAKLYNSVSSINDYNFVHEKVLRYYADMDSGNKELNETFDVYLQTLLSGFDGDHSGNTHAIRDDKILTPQISMKIEDLILSLVSEATDDLLSSEPIEDTNDSEENNMLASDQKIVLNRLLNVKSPLQKLNHIAGFTSIHRFVSEPILGSSKILLEVLVVKLFSKANFSTLVQVWPTSLSVVMEHVAESWIAVFDFLSVTLSRKLEDLSFASNDSSSIDVSLFLGDYADVASYGSGLCVQMCESVKELNEITTDSNPRMRLMLKKLVELKSKVSMVLIDMLTSLRVFYTKFSAGNSFKNFHELFAESVLKDYVSGPIHADLKRALLDVYFIEEARLAHKRGKTLERGSGEDVNYDDFVFETEENASSDTWDSEKELCIYTVKLFSFQRTGALGDEVTSRLDLNKKCLGPVYSEIVRQNINRDSSD